MGIKLRNLARRSGLKLLAIILCIASLTVAFLQGIYVDTLNVSGESIIVKDYHDSDDFHSMIQSAIIATGIARGELSSQVWQDMLSNNQIHYYLENEEGIVQSGYLSKKEEFESYEYFYLYEKGKIFTSASIRPTVVYPSDFDGTDTFYMAIEGDYIQLRESQWKKEGDLVKEAFVIIVIMLLLALITFIYLMCVIGKRAYREEVIIWKIDYIYTEIAFLLAAIVGELFIVLGNDIIWNFRNRSLDNFETGISTLGFYLLAGLTLVTLSILSVLGSSLIRKCRSKLFFRRFAFYIVFRKIKDTVITVYRSLFDASLFGKHGPTKALFYRQTIFILSEIAVAFMLIVSIGVQSIFSLFLFALIGLYMIYWYIRGNIKIYKNINEGINESLEEQMKAERMKVALITNVSHDLKTPLTSIISYADLLSKEELTDAAKDYVRVLQDKSERLKNIVVDLFDLAKSTSGNINLEFEALDLKRLMEQTLADMSDRIEASRLRFKVTLPDNPSMIMGDGKRLYRVFQNLFDNTIKYAMPDTRVFIEMKEEAGKVITEIKNISAYEMDFTVEEVLQRFNRGDKSRSTEGSGLGLSIAESFAKVCGGEFKLTIDGDMFKVLITFPLNVTKIK